LNTRERKLMSNDEIITDKQLWHAVADDYEMLAEGSRYAVLEGSESGHCCFRATLIDYRVRKADYSRHGEENPRYFKGEGVAEFFDADEAMRLLDTLERNT